MLVSSHLLAEAAQAVDDVVVVDAAVAGKNGKPPLGSTASTDQMLKLGVLGCVAMLVVGIVAAGGEYRHRTIVPATLVTPRRGAQMAAKSAAVALAGAILAGLTFGSGLATIAAELSAHGLDRLPPATAIAVLGGYAAALLAASTPFVIRRDIG